MAVNNQQVHQSQTVASPDPVVYKGKQSLRLVENIDRLDLTKLQKQSNVQLVQK